MIQELTPAASAAAQTPSVHTMHDSPRAKQTASAASTAAHTLALVQKLQTTLELERLVELFAAALAAAFPFDGLAYSAPQAATVFRRGRQARHSCSTRRP